MAKIILWITVFFGALLVVRLLNVAKAKQRRQGKARAHGGEVASMVRCVRCGVYLPRDEAMTFKGGHVCGDRGCKARD